MSGWAQAVFAKCRDVAGLQIAVTKLLVDEPFRSTARALALGTITRSKRGFAKILPAIPGFFLEQGRGGAPRIARLARLLRAPVYEVDVRSGSAVSLIEADPIGRLRLSGAPIHDADDEDPIPVASSEVGFGLHPVTDTIREGVERLDGTQLASYLGELAGFPDWLRARPDAAATHLVFDPRPVRSAR